MISFEVIWQVEGSNLYANVGVYKLSVLQAPSDNYWFVHCNALDSMLAVANGESNSISEACELAERALHVELLRL